MNVQRPADPQILVRTAVRSGSYAVTVVIVCGFMAMIDGADAQTLSIAAPLFAKTLAMSSGGVGLMFSIAAAGGALGYFSGGFLSDRLGAKAVAVSGAVVIGLFQLVTSYATDAFTLIAIRFVVGLALAAVVPALVTIIADVTPGRLRHRVQGLFWACFPIGVIGGGILSSWILSHGRWQNIFVVGGSVPLFIAGILWAITPARTEISTIPESVNRSGLIAQFLQPQVLLTGFIFFFTNGAIAVVLNWTPTLLVRTGFEPATGASAIAWQAAGALLTMSATGFIVERSRVWPIFASLVSASCATVLYACSIQSLPIVHVSMMLVGGFLAFAGTGSVFLAAAILPGNNRATGIGLCLTIGRAGQMILPGLIGLSLQAGGTPRSVLLLTATLPAVAAASALILALLSREPDPAT